MTQRQRKHRINVAMRAWIASDPSRAGGGFVPVDWYSRRNPRVMFLHSKWTTDELKRGDDTYEGPLLRGEIGHIDCGYSFVKAPASSERT